MKRWIATLLLLTLFAPAAFAQGAAKPKLDVGFEEAEAAPGQFLTLRFTVLVPTWLPKPVGFPSLEAPNIRVRLPEKSTTAISKPVGGETWSGVSRRYLIAPLVPGSFTIPPQEIRVTYADPGGDPITETMRTEAITFTGIVPEGAAGLDPFIAADELTLKQNLEGEPAGMAPGASVKRAVTAHIEGASPMVLPQLIPATDIPGIAAYPEEPVVTESDDRGVLSGERRESVTLMAESGGAGHAPEIEIRWFNLQTKKIETVKGEGFDIDVDAPAASAATAEIPYRRIAFILAGIVALGLVLRWGAPRLRAFAAERRRRERASEGRAFKTLLGATGRRDLPATYTALDAWAARKLGLDPRRFSAVQAALTGIGAAHYRPGAGGDERQSWADLEKALKAARNSVAGHAERGAALPPLNG